MTGLWNAGTVYALSTLQTNIYAVTQWDTRDQTNNTTTYPTGYVLGSYPIITKTLSINYYDDYNNIPNLPAGYQVTNGVSTMTKGLLTASLTAVLNTITNATPDMLWDVNYYDDKGRNIRSYKQHYLGGTVNAANFDVVLSTYNFNNQVTSTNRRHFTTATPGSPKLTIINQYSYDHMGRKLTTREQIQNGTLTADVNPILSKTDYNELGQVWKKHLHSTDSTTFKQDITYGYNERGWLLTSSAPLFAEQLYYNTSGTGKQYNGNIANQFWGTAGNLNNHYSYYYDQLNRLTSAGATTGNNETGITYDMMGNITALKRDKANTPVDQLSYTYTTGTNTLQSVTDATANDYGQMHGTTSYTYDGNGNLLTDNSKGITGISYNLLNLPQAITGKSTTYTYDATGQKLSRLINTAKTDYIGGIQYDGTSASSTVTFIQTEEGRALPKDGTSYNYEYSLTDHLGNSRVNFDTGTGTTRQVQVDDYYAFGMEINTSVASPKNEYLYNKKELQENLGLYDYGARFYDPVIARWTSVDPLAEKDRRWSPYSYGHNNPIRNIDVDGMFVAPGDLFKTADAAATDFGKYYNGKSILESTEYATTIYKVEKDGKTFYSYSPASPGTDATSTATDAPTGTEAVADAHTHGSFSLLTDDNFGKNDIITNNKSGLTGYVATPDGSLKKYDPETKKTSVVGTSLPSDSKDPNRKNDISPITGKSEAQTRSEIMKPDVAKQDAIPKKIVPPSKIEKKPLP